MRESTIEKYLHKQVTLLGGTTYKWTSPGRVGVPDRIVLWSANENRRAHVEFVEVKAPGGVLSPSQKREHKRLRAMGFKVSTVWSKALVDYYVS